MADEKKPRVEKGSACSLAFLFQRCGRIIKAPKGELHAVLSVNFDGSGNISLYRTYHGPSPKVVQRERLGLKREDFVAIREAIDSQIPR